MTENIRLHDARLAQIEADKVYEVLAEYADTRAGKLLGNSIARDYTLRQTYSVNAMIAMIQAVAELPDSQTDPRNAGAVEMCREIVSNLREKSYIV